MGWEDLPTGHRLQTLLSVYRPNRWIWNLFDSNGDYLATSGTIDYAREADAMRGARRTFTVLQEELGAVTQATLATVPPADPEDLKTASPHLSSEVVEDE
jgi:hypothetical protein